MALSRSGEPTGRMALVDGRDEHEPAGGGRFFWKGPSPRLGCRRMLQITHVLMLSCVLGVITLALATALVVVLSWLRWRRR